ncbi:MAG: ABC-2 type transport system permease protein, partial [Sediminicola sp.]
MKRSHKHIINLALLLAGLILLNIFGTYFYKRFDLTQDKRFTLSEAAKNIIVSVDSPIVIDVFLKGSFPPEFKRLQTETEQLLEEFSAFNSNIQYEFIDPLESEENPVAIQQQLQQMGLTTAQVEVRENGKVSTELVYPWALAYYKEKTVKIPLLKN